MKSLGSGASEPTIVAASARLGVNLVGGYRLFLQRFGWGGVGSFELYGLGSDVPPYLDLVSVTESERAEMHPALPPYLVPLMNDGGGNLYCLDSRTESEPPVVFWNHAASAAQELERVAADFLSWMAERVERPD